MPKVGIFSDLHMEFNTERNGIPWDFEPEPDAFYICAGDIHSNDEKREAFINKHAKHMFWVLGNHDYYGGKFPSGYQNCMAYVDKNTGLSIKGDTLWTNLTQDRDWVLYQNDLVDSRLIREITKEKYNDVHQKHVDYLFDETNHYDIIVTHHCPSFKSVHNKYMTSLFNASFATSLDEKILAMKNPPKLWIHGHTHEKCDYMIGTTRVICHPRGYPNEQLWYSTYKPMIVEID